MKFNSKDFRRLLGTNNNNLSITLEMSAVGIYWGRKRTFHINWLQVDCEQHVSYGCENGNEILDNVSLNISSQVWKILTKCRAYNLTDTVSSSVMQVTHVEEGWI